MPANRSGLTSILFNHLERSSSSVAQLIELKRGKPHSCHVLSMASESALPGGVTNLETASNHIQKDYGQLHEVSINPDGLAGLIILN